MLVVGVDAPGAGNAELHDLMVTKAFHAMLPAELRRHLHAKVVDRTRTHRAEAHYRGPGDGCALRALGYVG